MPYVEVDDAVYAALTQNGVKVKDVTAAVTRAAAAETVWNKLLNSGKNRTEALRLYKAEYPDQPVPELDAAAPVTEGLAAVNKRLDDWFEAQKKEKDDEKTRRDEESATSTIATGRRMLRTDRKLDDEGVKAVEEVMQKFGIPNYEVAFNHWKASQPPDAEPLPTAHGARSLDWFKVEEERPDQKLLLTDPMAFRRRETQRVMQEIREGRLAAA
jgi:hypothetical protein